MSGSDKTKGHAHRSLSVPGYHIHPQFDMVHTRHLINYRKHKKSQFTLNLAPMVDMFSILVIYLIMNFSSSGEIFFISKQIEIPKATKGVPMESFPLISVVADKVTFDIEKIEGSDLTFSEEPNDGTAPKLRANLKRIRDIELQIGGEKNFKGQVNLQADVKAKVGDIKKVMKVLIEEGWISINFVVDPSSQQAQK